MSSLPSSFPSFIWSGLSPWSVGSLSWLCLPSPWAPPASSLVGQVEEQKRPAHKHLSVFKTVLIRNQKYCPIQTPMKKINYLFQNQNMQLLQMPGIWVGVSQTSALSCLNRRCLNKIVIFNRSSLPEVFLPIFIPATEFGQQFT